MKKRFLALLIAAVMLVAMMSTVGMAALKYGSNGETTLSFTTFEKNSPDSTDINYASGLRITNPGVALDYEPVSGLFGKDASDVAVKATRLPNATTESVIGPKTKLIVNPNCPENGEWINVNWEWAFGDMNTERFVEIKFYNEGGNHSYEAVNSFSYTSAGVNVSDVLRISPQGTIRFFGKTLSNLYFFETDEWYNFDIRIKTGHNTVTNSDGAVTDPGEKATAYLYIDSVLIAQQQINNAADDVEKIYNPHCIFRVDFKSVASKYPNTSVVRPETTYIDNIKAGYYKSNGNSQNWAWMIDSGVVRDYSVSSKSDNFLTDGLHIALKNPQTVAELKSDLEYLKSDTAGIMSLEIVDENRTILAEDAQVTSGCSIRIRTKSNSYTHYWYRKIVDNITYINNAFEGGIPGRNSAGSSNYAFEEGNWWNIVDYGIKTVSAPGKYTSAAYAYKKASYASDFNILYNIGYTGNIDSDKYVSEVSVLIDTIDVDFPEVRIVAGNRTMASLFSNIVRLHANDGSWPIYYTKTGRINNRWYNFAFEVDKTENTVKIYINGDYTGVTLTNATSNYQKKIGILAVAPGGSASKGYVYIDDVKVYSGSYTDGLNVTSNNDKIVIASNDTIKLEENVTAEELVAATGADAIYTYADGEFGDEITSGVLPKDAVAVFKSDDTNIVKYYDIVYAPVMGDVEFDTSVEGKISAKVTFDNKSDLNMYKEAKLIIASYDNSGKGKKLSAVDVFAKNDMIVGANYLTATIDFDESKEIVAYLWKANGAPYVEAVPYIAE